MSSMARAEQVSPTEWNVYETVSDTDSRLYWVTSLDRNIPTGAQIEAGLDANGDPGIHSGSTVPVAGENGPYPQTGLDAEADYATHFVQNISDYKGFYQSFAGGLLGPLTFTRAGTQDGVDSNGDPYTAAENVPAYVLSPPEGALLQSEEFDANGETTMVGTMIQIGLNGQTNDYSGQIIFTTRTDQTGLNTRTFVNLSDGSWNNAIEVGSSASGATGYLFKRVSGASSYVDVNMPSAPAGTRRNIKFRASSSGLAIWMDGGVKQENLLSTDALASAVTTLTIGAQANGGQQADITFEVVRIVDADLSDAEIEAW